MPLLYLEMRFFQDLFPVSILALHINTIPKMHRTQINFTHFPAVLHFEYQCDLRKFVCMHVKHKNVSKIRRPCVVRNFGCSTAQLFATEGYIKFNKWICKEEQSTLDSCIISISRKGHSRELWVVLVRNFQIVILFKTKIVHIVTLLKTRDLISLR